jgi:predicted Rossmann fold nucleotide-binding protein DprA/Smf involved in DNA uptake
MRLAVTGTRRNDDFRFVIAKLDELYGDRIGDVEVLISGNAIGVDRNCEVWAAKHGIPVERVKPDYKRYRDEPRFAPIARNWIIAETCDELVAFRPEDGSSRGAQSTIDRALKLGKKVTIVPTEVR